MELSLLITVNARYGYLAVPLAGLWAFPRRRWIWMLLLIPFGAISLTALSLSELDSLSAFSVPAALLVLVPILIAIMDHWVALRMNTLFWFILVMCLVPLARVALLSVMGEAWFNRDGYYCWDIAELAHGECRLNPWLLAEAGLAYAAVAISFYGSIPAAVGLLILGWQRRRTIAPARSQG